MHALPELKRGIVVVALPTLMQRLPPRRWIESHALELTRGQRLDTEAFRARLIAGGYASVAQVMAHGEFAVRGSLIDLFPMGSRQPLRIDLFGDEIDSIRAFDPESQRSAGGLDRVRILPAREYPLNPDGIREFRRRFRARFEGDPNRSALYRQVSEALAPAGIEYYLPLFFEQLATLFDYLPPSALLVDAADLETRADSVWQETTERFEQRRHDVERPVLEPREISLPPGELRESVGRFPVVEVSTAKVELQAQVGPAANFPTRAPPHLRVDPRAPEPAAALGEFLRSFEGRVLLAAESRVAAKCCCSSCARARST